MAWKSFQGRMNESLIGVGATESGKKEVGASESRPTLHDCKGTHGVLADGEGGVRKGLLCFVLRREN